MDNVFQKVARKVTEESTIFSGAVLDYIRPEDGGGGGNHAYPQVIELLKVL